MSKPKTVLITGASSGIGQALSVEFARHGAYVALVARREAELRAVASEVRAAGGRAWTIVCDVADDEAVFDAVSRADRELGGLEMVVANAGVGSSGHASTLRWSDTSRLLDVNVKGAFATLSAAIPIFLAQQRGHLVGVSSLAGKRGLPGSGAYSASKAALSAFLETLRVDLGPAGIRVTDVQPGFVATPINPTGNRGRPMLWTPEKAARVIATRLERAPRVVSFPWPLAWATSAARVLPGWLFDCVARLAV